MAEEYFETPSDSIAVSEALVKGIAKPLTDEVTFAESEIEGLTLNLVDHICCFDDSASGETHLTGTGTINAGTEDFGTYINAQAEDGVLWEVGDEVATPGLDIEWALNAGSRIPHCVHFVGKYVGHPINDLNVDIWNYDTTDWDTLGTISRSLQIQSLDFDGITSDHVDGSHNMKVRIQQPAEGRTQDSLFVDHLCVHVESELQINFNHDLTDSISLADSEIEAPEKVLTDVIPISEGLITSPVKILSDLIAFADSEIEDTVKALVDTHSIAEAIAKAIVKPALVDSISFAESISKIAVQLNLTANQTFAEEIAKNVALGKTDTLSIAEAVAKAVGLYKDDSQSIAEAKAWFFNKIITDQITPFADSSILYDVTQEVWWGAIKWRTACHGGI